MLVAVRDGDEQAFVRLTGAFRRPLHIHCYRVLGSLHARRIGERRSCLRDRDAAPAAQRVVVVLRDALGWSAREVADLLDDTVPAVNSALQRGRARLEQERKEGTFARAHKPADRRIEEQVMRRFREAWARVDIEALVALLADDALLTMPPEAARFEGSAAIGAFFATVPLDGNLDQIRLVLSRANGQPVLAAYAAEDQGAAFGAYGVMVFAIDGDQISGITGFPRQPDLFTRLGLPTELDPATQA